MSNDDHTDTFVLQEFRLRASASVDDVARIVATFAPDTEPVPLLISIDDQRDVATLRAVHSGESVEADPRERAALGSLVTSWQPLRQYGPRITERSDSPPSYYRLAVTESGINDLDPAPLATFPRKLNQASSSMHLGLLWIGLPLGTHAGLLTLVGSDGDELAMRPDPSVWPLPLSRPLGVRIYESRR